MSEDPDLRRYDSSVPYYDRTDELRSTRATLVKFLDSFGTHLICPRRACQREGGCADRDLRRLPFCWTHYRGMLRFTLCVAAKRLGIDDRNAGANTDMRMPGPSRGRPLLATWKADGVRIADLARPASAGPEDWDWETMPEYRELFRKLTEGEDGQDGAPAASADGTRSDP